MDPGLKEEPKSSPTGTGLETPRQQCPPNEGIWKQRRTTANGFVTAGVDSSQGGRTPSPPERSTSTRTFADIFSIAATPPKRRHKPFNEENKQFDPGGQGEKARLGTRLYSTFFFGGELGSSLLFSVCVSFFVAALCVSVFFPKLFFLSQVKLISEAEGRHGSSR